MSNKETKIEKFPLDDLYNSDIYKLNKEIQTYADRFEDLLKNTEFVIDELKDGEGFCRAKYIVKHASGSNILSTDDEDLANHTLNLMKNAALYVRQAFIRQYSEFLESAVEKIPYISLSSYPEFQNGE